MDLSESIAPRSDQWNADDLIAGPVTVTIADAKPGAAEQPVDILLVETPKRAYRPSKSMRRVIVTAWGVQSSNYAGRRLTLYRNPDITFSGEKVGGIEISHMSHIDEPLTLALTRSRGKRTPFTVQPLREAPTRDWAAEADALDDLTALADLWRQAPVEARAHITERAATVRAAAPKDDSEAES